MEWESWGKTLHGEEASEYESGWGENNLAIVSDGWYSGWGPCMAESIITAVVANS